MSNFNVYLEKIQKSKINHVYNEAAPLGMVGQLLSLVALLGVISITAIEAFKFYLEGRKEKKEIKDAAIEIINKYKKPNGKIPAIINQDGTINKEAVDSLSVRDKRVIYGEISNAIGITGEESGIGKKEQEEIFKTDSRLSEEGRKEYLANRKKLGEDIWRRNKGNHPKQDDLFK